jgi:hypothetical protein
MSSDPIVAEVDTELYVRWTLRAALPPSCSSTGSRPANPPPIRNRRAPQPQIVAAPSLREDGQPGLQDGYTEMRQRITACVPGEDGDDWS